MGVSFIGGGNRRTRRKPPTCGKSLTHFIILSCSRTHRHERDSWKILIYLSRSMTWIHEATIKYTFIPLFYFLQNGWRVWRYQRGNQNPYIEEEQTTQWPKEKVQKDKQRSTKHTNKTKDRVTRTPLKSLVYITFPVLAEIIMIAPLVSSNSSYSRTSVCCFMKKKKKPFHTFLCCILFVSVLCLECPMLPVSLGCPFLIAPSAFFNVY